MSQAQDVAAVIGTGVGAAVIAAGVIAIAVLCPDAFPPPQKTVVYPTYTVTSGPYVIEHHIPNCRVRLPRSYKYEYIRIGGTDCKITRRHGQWCYQYGNRFYPIDCY